MSKHIGVLLTNNDTSAFARAFPDDGQKVVARLQPLRPAWRYTVFDVTRGVLPAAADALDGVVITGSPASVNDAGLPWLPALSELIRQLHAMRTPTVGICFGHQAIAQALGGRVDTHLGGWGLGLGLTHWHTTRPWMAPPLSRMWLMAAHTEQVTRMPPGAVCLGSSDVCPVAAMALDDHLFTTQFHPEMPRAFMLALIDHLADGLDAATLARARASLAHTEASDVFAEWMVRFLDR